MHRIPLVPSDGEERRGVEAAAQEEYGAPLGVLARHVMTAVLMSRS